MKRIERIVFATNNEHKLKEARAILGSKVTLVSLKEIGCEEDIPETSSTLLGNARQKARYVKEHYGVDCIADDTGLMVDALDGAPGVLSARYAGPGHDSKANMQKLLKEMEGKSDRKAHFSTVLSLVTSEGEKEFEGRVDGTIAETQSGTSGFGYDPVFIADETGETFANMSEEAKNSISHRGRAFRQFAAWLKTLAVLLMLVTASPTHAEQWRQHASFDDQALRIIPTSDYTYFLLLKQTYDRSQGDISSRFGQILRYDNAEDEWEWLDTDSGLSEHIVADIAYDENNRQLVVGYDNGNIDLIKANGDKVNIPGLMGASDTSKTIESINIDKMTGDIWITTSSGYVRIDAKKGEIITSRNYGKRIYAVAKYNEQLFVGAEDGLYYGDERESNLSNLQLVPNTSQVTGVYVIGQSLYYMAGSGKKVYMYKLGKDASGYSGNLVSLANEYSIQPGKDGILTCGQTHVRWFDKDGSNYDYKLPSGIKAGATAGSSDGKTIWFSNGRKGLSRMTVPTAGSSQWTVSMDNYRPNSSTAFQCVALAQHPEFGMLVRNHGAEQNFSPYVLFPDLICAYHDGVWTPMGTTYRLDDPAKTYYVANPVGLAIDPNNTDHVYSGSREQGILRLDLKEPKNSLRLTRKNDEQISNNAVIGIVDPMETWVNGACFTTPIFDKNGTMWVSNSNTDTYEAELWYWTADNRSRTTSANNYRPLGKLVYKNLATSSQSFILPLAYSGRSNMLVYFSGTGKGELMILDHAGTPSDQSDDQYKIINVIYDQDGNQVSYDRCTSATEDPATGRVWVTCNQGLYHFDPKELLAGSNVVRRVKVPRNDGTNLADYLLDGMMVTKILIDKNGRKWFGTFGAGIVVTDADGTEIIRTYTAENSELPDNVIHGMSFNSANNSMMISTGKGLCELFLDGISDGSSNDVRAYPNPVRPGYMGMVTIDNLAEYATVKIVDAQGNLVKELGQAPTGEITWDLTNLRNKRVTGGVYYIIANNGQDQESYSKKGKLLVIE